MIHIENLTETKFKWFLCAIEKGDINENMHLQGCFSLKNASTWTAVHKMLELKGGDYLSEQKSSQVTNVLYCSKGKQTHEEWEISGVDGENYGVDFRPLKVMGDLPQLGESKVNQWDDIRQAVENGWSDLDIVARWPQEGIRCASHIAKYRLLWDRKHAQWRDVQVVYIWGKTGTGKTRAVTTKYGYQDSFRVTDYPNNGDRANGAFDMYDGQDVLIFEEFRSSIKLTDMLNYLDGHPVELACRYANQLMKATKIFILSNIPLDEQYRSFHDENASIGKMNSWEAFNRRISGVIEVREGETLKAEDLPLLYGEEFVPNEEE
jgi:hypothetical protein